MHENIDPKNSDDEKNQVLRMMINEGVQKYIQGGFVKFQKELISHILIREIIGTNWM